MSRQQNHTRDRKQDGNKRDAASNGDHYMRNDKEPRFNQHPRRDDNIEHIAGLNRYRLNDLYERSSI